MIPEKYRELIRIQATLLHELRHAVISTKNNVKKTNNNLYSFRRGLCKISLYNKRIINIYGNYLDEIYNTHLTNMNMTELLLLKKNIQSDYLNSLINHQCQFFFSNKFMSKSKLNLCIQVIRI